MTIEQLKETAEKCGLDWNDETAGRFETYADLLKEWNEKMNLTAIVEKEEVFEKHFADCLLPLKTGKINGSVCDVGSGAGFPGLVWAIVRKDLDITLLEPLQKRCTFLNEAVKTLGLTNVHIVNGRAEEKKELLNSFDITTARAVANLSMLSEFCLPLTKVGGIFVAMKGPSASEELENAKHALLVLGAGDVEVIEETLNGAVRTQLLIHKERTTPSQYPRPFARMKKKPL